MKISVISVSIRPKGLEITQSSLSEQSFQDFEWIQEISIPKKGHDLNAAYNRALRRAKGELMVSLQDYIKPNPKCLEMFWEAYQNDKKTFFTAPVGKTDKEDFSGSCRWDWRAYEDAKPSWQHWEIDCGAAPMEALREIGGFDETLDGHWSTDNVNVGYRAHLAGYKFKHLFHNPSVAYDHDAFIPHPFRNAFDPDFSNMRLHQFTAGERLSPLT